MKNSERVQRTGGLVLELGDIYNNVIILDQCLGESELGPGGCGVQATERSVEVFHEQQVQRP